MSEKLTADKRLHPRCASCRAQTQCLFFSEIPVHVLSSIQAVVQVRWCRRADMIFREGEPTSGFFIVRSGWSTVFNIRPDGRKSVTSRAGTSSVMAPVEPGGTIHALVPETASCGSGAVVAIPFVKTAHPGHCPTMNLPSSSSNSNEV